MKTTVLGTITAALWGVAIVLAAVGVTTWAVAARVVVATFGAYLVFGSIHHHIYLRRKRGEFADTHAAITKAMENVERNINRAAEARRDIEAKIEEFRATPITVVVREHVVLNPGDILRVDRSGNLLVQPLSREN